MNDFEILQEAIDRYGMDAQLKMVLEEMSELQKEICKFWRGKDNLEQIADEVADVEIMLEQVRIIFQIEDVVDEHISQKISRLRDRLSAPTKAESVSMPNFRQEKIYPNCTVQVLRDIKTGEESWGWWPNDNPPRRIIHE